MATSSKVSPESGLLQAEQPQLAQPFSTGKVFQPSDHFCGLLWTHSSFSGDSRAGRRTPRGGLSRVEQRGGIPSLGLLPTLLGVQPRGQLAWAASVCCQLISNFFVQQYPQVLLSWAALSLYDAGDCPDPDAASCNMVGSDWTQRKTIFTVRLV